MGVRKTLVMWSGGLDSTYGLVRVLRETDDEVFAHHIRRRAPDDSGRGVTHTCEYESAATRRMHSFIETTYRPFCYSESEVILTAFRTFARDTSTAMFFAGQCARACGFTSDDRILFSFNSDEDKSWNPGSELHEFLRFFTINILRIVWGGETPPNCFLWTPCPSKRQEANYLPHELFAMTASCRSPKKARAAFEPCGRCPECVTLSSVTHEAMTGNHPEREPSRERVADGAD